jgi:hypothetical protein
MQTVVARQIVNRASPPARSASTRALYPYGWSAGPWAERNMIMAITIQPSADKAQTIRVIGYENKMSDGRRGLTRCSRRFALPILSQRVGRLPSGFGTSVP